MDIDTCTETLLYIVQTFHMHINMYCTQYGNYTCTETCIVHRYEIDNRVSTSRLFQLYYLFTCTEIMKLRNFLLHILSWYCTQYVHCTYVVYNLQKVSQRIEVYCAELYCNTQSIIPQCFLQDLYDWRQDTPFWRGKRQGGKKENAKHWGLEDLGPPSWVPPPPEWVPPPPEWMPPSNNNNQNSLKNIESKKVKVQIYFSQYIVKQR